MLDDACRMARWEREHWRSRKNSLEEYPHTARGGQYFRVIYARFTRRGFVDVIRVALQLTFAF